MHINILIFTQKIISVNNIYMYVIINEIKQKIQNTCICKNGEKKRNVHFS
jgi:hypothetical protein